MATQIRDVVEQYVKLVASGPIEDIVELYAPDAVVEDPVGTPPKQGHAAIREFYEMLTPLDRETELRPENIRIAGNAAAFSFTVVTTVGEQRIVVSPIDVMEFDDEGRICRMRAYWGEDNTRVDRVE
ncbi:nuclear transport factor 2 family protein [Nocardia sp. CNY236]|uniref:nuclear transport factor 2 family protein n=1 Tax=Nocardia sp. CNY236 TaxID=1169152 RepID=UPI00040077E5|nr:nuclear transport factor 2 family protein [Nocardia sp. CNY236]